MKNWKVNSWRKFPVKHIPKYDDEKELSNVLNKLKTFPPLVFAGETRHLKEQLAKVVDGKAFLLQGGDCAESFAEFHPDNIRDTFKVILQMSLILTYSASLPVVKLAPEDTPIIVFLTPEVTVLPALAPIATLFPSAPVVLSATNNA